MLAKTEVIFFLSFLPIVVLNLVHPCCSSSEVDDEHEFDYLKDSGKGPREWGKLNPEWRTCDKGKMQSPIDLLDKRVKVLPGLGRLQRSYKPAKAVLRNRGHDIMLRWKGKAGSMTIDGMMFDLKQCHWHSPSEHTFRGSRYQLELHMVHESANNKTAVVGITYKYGRPDPFLQKLMPSIKANLTDKEDEADAGVVDPIEIKLGSRKYFRYMGSLTVPPCSEGVIWTIVKKVRTVSREQVKALREAVDDGCRKNARPLQRHQHITVLFYTPGGGRP